MKFKLTIAYDGTDYQGWQVQKIGTVIADHQILTTADEMFDRTMVRLQKDGRGRWWEGEVKWIDYHANLALVTVSDPEFWVGLKPVALERVVPSDGNLQILRWREGNLVKQRTVQSNDRSCI